MRLHIISVGSKIPTWVEAGYQDYAQRLPADFRLHLIEIPIKKRSANMPANHAIQQEGEAILKAIPKNAFVIALNIPGELWSTEKLAEQLNTWRHNESDICFIIGGPDGLAPECLKRAQLQWSLSRLTLPHALVRVILAEQLYRAWSILHNHPYHRK